MGWQDLPQDLFWAVLEQAGPTCIPTARLVCLPWLRMANGAVSKIKVDLAPEKPSKKWTLQTVIAFLFPALRRPPPSSASSSTSLARPDRNPASRSFQRSASVGSALSSPLGNGCTPMGSRSSCVSVELHGGPVRLHSVSSNQHVRQLQLYPLLSKVVLAYGRHAEVPATFSAKTQRQQVRALATYVDATLSQLQRVPHMQLVGWHLASTMVPLARLRHLTSLDLSGCHMGSAQDAMAVVWPSLPSLKCLILKGCQLRSLDGLGALLGLKSLDLSRNSIASIPPDVAMGWRSLKDLDLAHNCLTAAPVVLAVLPKLKRLQLSYQGLCPSAWPSLDLFQRAKSWQELKLKGVRLSDPQAHSSLAFLGGLTNLRRLELKNNGIVRHELPTFFSSLVRLERLKYSGNRLSSVSGAVLARMQALKILELPNNQLDALPYELGSLPSLQVLNLSINALVSLPRSLSQLTALRKLSLKANLFPITQPADLLVGLDSLELLDIRFNQHLEESFHGVACANGRGRIVSVLARDSITPILAPP